jgi:hypothetical protein
VISSLHVRLCDHRLSSWLNVPFRDCCSSVVSGRISCRVVRVFCLSNLSADTFYRLFLAEVDITLKRFNDATHICGYIPRQCLKATSSPNALLTTTNEIKSAITETTKLRHAITSVSSGKPIHRLFQIYPSLPSRDWGQYFIRPISDWALSEMLAELDLRDAGAAYTLYQRIKGSIHAAELAGRMFETRVHEFFRSTLAPSTPGV